MLTLTLFRLLAKANAWIIVLRLLAFLPLRPIIFFISDSGTIISIIWASSSESKDSTLTNSGSLTKDFTKKYVN